MHTHSPRRRSSLRHVIADMMITDGGDDISELRAIVAALETPADRLLARYRGRSDRPLAGLRRPAARAWE